MMCTGHLCDASIYVDGSTAFKLLQVIDSKPDVDGEFVDGDVVQVELGLADDATYIGFNLDQARAFIEAFQEILNRYDK